MVCRLLLAEDVKRDFNGLRQSDTGANYIVVGDIGNVRPFPLINEVFNCLMQGAKLIAIHKNRFWQTEQGLQMDIGGFIEGLGYASGCKTMLIEEPSHDFFHIALGDMGLEPEEAAIIGDDFDADIGGGQQVGLTGILVKIEKCRQSYAEASATTPDLTIDSIINLPGLLVV